MSEASLFVETADRLLESGGSAPEGGFDRELWATVAEAGFDRLILPESLGGAGEIFEDAVAVLGRFGAKPAAVPLAETLVANWCLAAAGLPVPDGPKALALGTGPDDARLSDGRLIAPDGLDIAWGPIASTVVVVARDESGASIVTTLKPVGEVGIGRSVADELFWQLPAAAGGWAIGEQAALGRSYRLPLALMATFKAAQMAGAGEAALALTVEYAKTRKQFGRAIGAYQAVQHMMARMAGEVAASLAAVRFAARGLGHADPLWGAAVAKARASEAAGFIAATAHQVHGAMGFTREYPLHRFTRCLWAWREEVGNESYWTDRIGQAALGSTRGALWSGLTGGLQA